MSKLKSITDKSWIVLSDDGLQHIAVLSQQEEKFVLLAKDAKAIFNNKDELAVFFKKDIFADVIGIAKKKENTEYFIKGYPVDFNDPQEADINDELSDLPLYTKTEKSKIYFAAGFYCVNFPKRWIGSFCPKLSTLNKYDYKGPFNTEKEMKFVLGKARKCQKSEN